jgi:hypothetical protein
MIENWRKLRLLPGRTRVALISAKVDSTSCTPGDVEQVGQAGWCTTNLMFAMQGKMRQPGGAVDDALAHTLSNTSDCERALGWNLQNLNTANRLTGFLR